MEHNTAQREQLQGAHLLKGQTEEPETAELPSRSCKYEIQELLRYKMAPRVKHWASPFLLPVILISFLY